MTEALTVTARVGMVIVPVDRCIGCHRPLGPEGAETYRGHHLGCYVPTMDELGFKGFNAMQWYGSVGPAGIPADVVKRLNETQVAVLKAPDLAEKLAMLYQYMSEQLLRANLNNDPGLLDEVTRLLTELSGAWAAIGKQQPVATPMPAPAARGAHSYGKA